MLFGKAPYIILVKVKIKATAFEALKVAVPNFRCRNLIELRVIETDVNARSEGFVEFPDAIGRQNDDSRVVLKYSEENCSII